MPMILQENKYKSLILGRTKVNIINEMMADLLSTQSILVSKARLKAYLHYIAVAWDILDTTQERDPLMPRIEIYITHLGQTQIEFKDDVAENISLEQYGIDLDYLNNFETEFFKRYSIKRLLNIGNEPDEPYLELIKQCAINGYQLSLDGVIGGFKRIEIDPEIFPIHYTTTRYFIVSDEERSIQWIVDEKNEFIEPKKFFLRVLNHNDLDKIIAQFIAQGSHALLSMLFAQIKVHPEKRRFALQVSSALQNIKERNNTECVTNGADYIIEDLNDLKKIVTRSGFTKKLYESMGAPECILRIISSDIDLEQGLISTMIQYATTEHNIQLMCAIVKRYPQFVTPKDLEAIFLRDATLNLEKPTGDMSLLITHATTTYPNYWVNFDQQHPDIAQRIFIRAASGGYMDTIFLLLHSGLEIKNLFKVTSYGNGMNAFHLALTNEHQEMAKVMLDTPGAEELVLIRETGNEHEQATPLHLAIRHVNSDIIRRIVFIAWKKGSDFAKTYVLTPTNKQKTAIHYAAELKSVLNLRILLSCVRGTSLVKLKNHHGLTPLHYAVAYSRIENIITLLNYEKEHRKQHPAETEKLVAVQDITGKTVLHYVSNLFPEITQLLLAQGAQPQIKDKDGMTALHRAADENMQEVALVLLAHGGKSLAAIKNNEGKNACQLNTKLPTLSEIPYTPQGFMCDEMLHKLILETGMECVINDLKSNNLGILAYYMHGFKSYLLAMKYPDAQGALSLNIFLKSLMAFDVCALSGETNEKTSEHLLTLIEEIESIQKNIKERQPQITYLNPAVDNIFDTLPQDLFELIPSYRELAKLEKI